MTFQEANEKFSKFKSSNAPVTEGVKLKSRGKVFDLDFDLELIDGKVVLTAKPVKSVETQKPAKKR